MGYQPCTMYAGIGSSRGKSVRLTFSKRLALLLITCTSITLPFIRSHSHQADIIWKPHSVQSCQEKLCLQNSPFAAYIPFEEARTAHKYLRLVLERNVTTGTPRLLQSTSKLSECSVIGGAPSKGDPWHAKIIDASPAIRLNVRHPSFMEAEGISTSLGHRTDILLVQRGALRSYERYIHGWGQGNISLANQRRLAGEAVKQDHPQLLYRTECPSQFHACPESLKALNISTIAEWLPLWFLHPDIEILTRTSLERFGLSSSHVATTGATAVMVALQLCTRVNVFSMNGSIKGDGDFEGLEVWRGHQLNIERKFVRWLSTCSRVQSRWCGRVRVFS